MNPSRILRIHSELNRFSIVAVVLALSLLVPASSSAQLYTTTSDTGAWNSARWSSSPAGPFTGAWVSGSNTSFLSSGTYTFASMWTSGAGSGTIGDVTTGTNVIIGLTNSVSQQMGFGGAVKTFDFGAGSVVDFGGIALLGTGGNGLIKNGAGTLTLSGGNYQAGLTLNAGNAVARTNNGFGTGAFNINGGAIGSTANWTSPQARINGINIGGDFQIGISGSVGSASSTANMTFSGTGSVVNLTGATRKITLGSSGSMTFGGPISNGTLVLTRNAEGGGQITLSGSNTISALTLDGGRFNAQTSSLALGSGTVTIGGIGGYATTLNVRSTMTLANDFVIADSAQSKTIAALGVSGTINGTISNNDDSGGLQIGAGAGRTLALIGGINGSGTSNLTIGGTAEGVALSGMVEINAASTYSGVTTISSGTLALSGSGSIGTGGLNLGTTASRGVFDLTALTAGTFSLPATGNLAGSGTLSGNGKSLAVLGSFLPGNGPGGVGVGSGFTLDLSQSGTSVFEITSPAFTVGTFDVVSGGGSVNFGGTLNLNFSGGTYADGTNVLQLFTTTGGRSGSFSAVNFTGLAAGQSATFNPSTGFISLVPEPSTCASLLGGLAVGGFVVFRRRRQA